MTTRRDFFKQSGLAAAGLAASRVVGPAGAPRAWGAQGPRGGVRDDVPTLAADPATRELMAIALDAARRAGASYCDVRIARNRTSAISTRERQIVNTSAGESLGVGVRVLVAGTWGFAATSALTRDGVAAAARGAVVIAKANRIARDRPVRLAPTEVHRDVTWQSAFTIDPFTVPVEQQAALLLEANAAALQVSGVRFVSSGFAFVKEEKQFANSDGSTISQTIVRTSMPFEVTAVATGDFQSRAAVVAPAARGWEYVLQQDLAGNAPRWAEEAVEKLSAKSVVPGQYDLVLHPSHLWLTIHESIGHPTELDRALGYEANYAGTSFLAPPERVLGKLKYGPAMMNVRGDRSQPGGGATVGYDDEGVRPDDFLIVKNGVLNDYQTTREQATWLKWWYDRQRMPVRSHGCSHGDSWGTVQFQRMPNVSLLPGERDLSWGDLIAATDRGIAIVGDGSFSIDQQRYNAQFGGQLFHEIRNGKIVGMLKDVAYQLRTPDFWGAMDMIGGASSYQLGTAFNDGKGQPSQVNAVSHGCVPSRFRMIDVINTGRTS